MAAKRRLRMTHPYDEDCLGHIWADLGNLTMCKKCGWLKGGKKASEQCKGPPGISLRKTETMENEKMTEDQIKHMVNRFLGWKLPEDFAPDNGIDFNPIANRQTENEFRRNPVGTNLFTAMQAEAMVRYLVEGLPSP